MGSFWTWDQTHVSYVSSIGWQFLSTSTTWEGLYIWWKWKIAQSCPTICDPMHYTVHGILQARILKWVAFPFSQPTDRIQVSLIAGRFFTSWTIREAPYIWWRTPYIYSEGWWRTWKPGMLQSMRSQSLTWLRDWKTTTIYIFIYSPGMIEWIWKWMLKLITLVWWKWLPRSYSCPDPWNLWMVPCMETESFQM